MKYVIVDDEKIILRGMERTIKEAVEEDAVIFTCGKVSEALKVIEEQKPYVLFSDIDMPGMNGLELSKAVHEVSPKTHIIFVTGHPSYSLSAWNTAAEGFLLKPVSADDIKDIMKKVKEHETNLVSELLPQELQNLFRPNPSINQNVEKTVEQANIDIVCFGNFEIFYRKKPLHFTRKKSKEMFAYLVDRRGSAVSADEIRSILWEEEEDSVEKKGYIRVLANDIRKTFDNLGEKDILINNQNSYQIDISKIHCDYYDYLKNDKYAQKKFMNEYMSQYSWAEVTLGNLMDKN